MKYFMLLVLLGAFLNAEECLDYDEMSLEYLRTKCYSESSALFKSNMTQTMKGYGFGICLQYYDLDFKRKEREMDLKSQI